MNNKNLKIESFRRTQRGGQQCGLPNIGVKITHLPTGLTALCDYERSKMRNRDVCLAMLEWGLEDIGFTEGPAQAPACPERGDQLISAMV